ncbi:MAG: YbaY family lipoprotein [Aquimonas sp.]|nr:YbaY family lipoprotein [Aquimonas sp.]
MHAKLITLAIATALLSACGGSQPPAQAPAQQAAQVPASAPAPAQPQFDTAIIGDITVPGLSELPPGFDLSLRLLDITDPSQVPGVVAESNGQAPRQLPHRFALPYDPSLINEEGRYAVQVALMVQGVPLYSSSQPARVLTEGHGSRISVELVRGGAQAETEVAPTERMKQDFAALERGIGAMQRVVGERMNEAVTVGWDAFISGGEVRFAREQVNFADAGTAAFRYAYQNGQPWVIVREQGRVTTWLGWNADGELILNELEGGGVEAAEAERLRAQAAEVARLASASKG